MEERFSLRFTVYGLQMISFFSLQFTVYGLQMISYETGIN